MAKKPAISSASSKPTVITRKTATKPIEYPSSVTPSAIPAGETYAKDGSRMKALPPTDEGNESGLLEKIEPRSKRRLEVSTPLANGPKQKAERKVSTKIHAKKTEPLDLKNAVSLGISVDESFAEFSFVRGGKNLLAGHRVYLARESLKTALPAFLETHAEIIPDQVFVSARFLEKILDYRLGGSVAQLVSDGFENWLQIRSAHPLLHNLSNPDLIFSIRERISGQGEILTEIQTSDLESIEAKLKLMEVKRVCLHFLHSPVEAHNLNIAKAFLEERGFDVFVPVASENGSEVSRWRANTLNASISGTFLELKEQIEEACQDILPTDQIYFLSSQGQLFSDEKEQRLGSLFSTRTAVMQAAGQRTHLLYLGLEKFSWLEKREQNFWLSPWGQVELQHATCYDLKIQPTSQIDVNIFSEMDFSEKPESYEPGPMCMGRGQKPTLLDLYSENPAIQQVQGLADRITAPGIQRFRNTLMALSKGTASKGNVEIQRLTQQLRDLALQRIALEVHLRNAPTMPGTPAEPIKVVGPLANVFGPGLKALFPHWQIENTEFVDSLSVISTGQKWMEA